MLKPYSGAPIMTRDAAITAMIDLASRWLAYHTGRVTPTSGRSMLEYFANCEETLPAGESFVDLMGFPVVGEIVVVGIIGHCRGSVPILPLKANVDYRLDYSRVIRLTSGRDLGKAFAVDGGYVKVTYSGGWWPVGRNR